MKSKATARSSSSLVLRIPKEIRPLISGSENPFVTDADDMIERLNALLQRIPDKYQWKFGNVKAINAELKEVSPSPTAILQINQIYWRDQIGNWEAYSIMNALRVFDLARSGIWAIGRRDAMCACLLARAILETAASFQVAARTVSATLTGHKGPSIFDPDFNIHQMVASSTELEEYALKTIFSSRLSGDDDIYIPTNFLTIIAKVAKAPHQEFLAKCYEMLCEVSHPNFMGRALYLQASKGGPHEGSELREIGMGQGPTWDILAEPVVAALAWACAAQAAAFELLADALGMVKVRLDALPG